MTDQLTALEFSLDDEIAGQRLTLERLDLPTLRGFLEEVEKFIKGDVPGATLSDSRVRIEEGSVRVVALVVRTLAADVQADLTRLEETGDLDVIQPRRAEVIEQWQARARRSASRVYAIGTGSAKSPLRVANTSHFQHGSENAWVSVERYLAGRVVDLGGKQKPNVHLVLRETGKGVRIDATEEQLGGEKETIMVGRRFGRSDGPVRPAGFHQALAFEGRPVIFGA